MHSAARLRLPFAGPSSPGYLDIMADVQTFSQSHNPSRTEDLLQALKRRGKLPEISQELVSMLNTNPEKKSSLNQFFQSNLSSNPKDRIVDLTRCREIMDPDRYVCQFYWLSLLIITIIRPTGKIEIVKSQLPVDVEFKVFDSCLS